MQPCPLPDPEGTQKGKGKELFDVAEIGTSKYITTLSLNLVTDIQSSSCSFLRTLHVTQLLLPSFELCLPFELSLAFPTTS